MQQSIRGAISTFTSGDDSQRHFDLAAHRIQRSLLDLSVPSMPGLELGVHAEPARLVGGDYIDIHSSEDHLLVFGLGDASGKSLAAALNALMLRYLVRGLVRALGCNDLARIVSHTNAIVAEDLGDDGSFITFLLGAIDTSTGSLRVVNAGHEPPILLRAGSTAVETMTMHDIVLGVHTETHYVEETARLGPGDVAIFYTDGLTEATNERGELYTVERLREIASANRNLSAQGIADRLFEAVKAFSVDQMRDDATIFTVRRLAAGNGSA